jgi:Domain of unknown function (DUF4352)
VTYNPSPADQPWQQQEYTVGDYGQPQYQPGYPDPTQVPQPGYQPAGYPAQPGYPPQPAYQQPTAYPAPAYSVAPQPAPPKRRNVGLIVAIVAAALIVCGGAGVAGIIWAVKKSSGPGVPTVAIGTTLSVTTYDGNKADVTISNARADGDDVFVDVKVVSTKGEFPVNPIYLTLTDSSGKEYDLDFGAESKFLEPGDLPPGQTQTGDVAFIAPESVLHGGKIELDAPFKAVGYWTLG